MAARRSRPPRVRTTDPRIVRKPPRTRGYKTVSGRDLSRFRRCYISCYFSGSACSEAVMICLCKRRSRSAENGRIDLHGVTPADARRTILATTESVREVSSRATFPAVVTFDNPPSGVAGCVLQDARWSFARFFRCSSTIGSHAARRAACAFPYTSRSRIDLRRSSLRDVPSRSLVLDVTRLSNRDLPVASKDSRLVAGRRRDHETRWPVQHVVPCAPESRLPQRNCSVDLDYEEHQTHHAEALPRGAIAGLWTSRMFSDSARTRAHRPRRTVLTVARCRGRQTGDWSWSCPASVACWRLADQASASGAVTGRAPSARSYVIGDRWPSAQWPRSGIPAFDVAEDGHRASACDAKRRRASNSHSSVAKELSAIALS